MKLKIVSEGSTLSTSVVNAETGEPVVGIAEVSWTLKANHQVDAIIRVYGAELDVTADFGEELS